MSERASKARKRRRNTSACDQCSKRSVKCSASSEDPSRCQNCVDFDEVCAINRPIRRRPGRAATNASIGTIDASHETNVAAPQSWVAPIIVSDDTILALIDVFFEVIFPIFPFFHRASLKGKIRRRQHQTDRPLCAAVSALCALVSARIRDGAAYTSHQSEDLVCRSVPVEKFLDAADEALPKDAAILQHLGYMQACVLLALTSFQCANSAKTLYYISMYHAFVSVGSLHNEDAWASGLAVIEIEERRRLFWSTYTLDVFTSTIWKRPVRGRAAAFNVGYPTSNDPSWYEEVDISIPLRRTFTQEVSWLDGWNFITDLYRILERALEDLYAPASRTLNLHIPLQRVKDSSAALLEHIMSTYNALPAVLKTTRPVTGRMSEDIYSFQAANIAATVQLVRMVLFTVDGSDADGKCRIASDVIYAFAQVPVAYLRAISSPLLYHLTGIGMILGSTFETQMSDTSYNRVRTTLLDLATLISNLEAGMHTSAGTSAKLRAQVEKIEQYWISRRAAPTQVEKQPHDHGTMQLAEPLAGQKRSLLEDNMYQSPVLLPPEILEDWSLVFDLTQMYAVSGA